MEAYESLVQMAKNAQYLDPEDPTGFALASGNAPLPCGIFSSIDMFYVPPPPFCEGSGSDSDANLEQTIYTIVPGKLALQLNEGTSQSLLRMDSYLGKYKRRGDGGRRELLLLL